MATLAEFHRFETGLSTRRLVHLQRLVSWWTILADFSFADLLLFAPIDGDDEFQVIAQVRPTTSQTLYQHDYVGHLVDEIERPLVARCFRLANKVEGEVTLSAENLSARVVAIPIRHEGEVVGVLTKENSPGSARSRGELESVYLQIFEGFASMIADVSRILWCAAEGVSRKNALTASLTTHSPCLAPTTSPR